MLTAEDPPGTGAVLCVTPHCDTQTGGQPLTEAEALAQRPKPYGADITFVTRGPRSGACA